ncbi:MAG: MoxR family ATPase [Clostridia bacterium]|nr:MoxR family ATPase [Clostridia bacterium]
MTVEQKSRQILEELSKVIIGQDVLLRHLLIAFISGGHVLMEGVPGLGKTLSAKALARTVQAEFKRVQFTPDLMPADILGTNVFNMKTSEFYLKKGPIFTNVLLADEINRTPPKTQSALLEAMEEHSVTIDGNTFRLGDPFFVIATQNPVEYEGTYPLPEAQLDRFLMKLNIDYISQEGEDRLLKGYEGNFTGAHARVEDLAQVITPAELEECRKETAAVRVDDGILHYITGITFATRRGASILLGASPRASIALLLCARTAAAMAGRDYVVPEDVVDIALPVLRHRVILRPEAGAAGVGIDAALSDVIRKVEIPR